MRRSRSIALRAVSILVAVALAALAGARASAGAEERPLIAVVPFTGPQARAAEAVVVRALRRRAQLVPPSKWQASASKLFAATHNPEDVASVAEDVGARVVVTGVVKREGRAWQLVVSVRDGASGRSRDKLKYSLRSPRIPPAILEALAKEVDEAFAHALAAAPAPTSRPKTETKTESIPPKTETKTETPPSRLEPETRPVKTETKPKPRIEARVETRPEPAKPEPTPEPKPEPKPAPPARVAQPLSRRPRWAPYLDAAVGGSISGRNFDFDPASQPRFKSGIVGGLHVDVTAYPLAFLWRSAGGVIAGLGLGITLDKPFWVDSTPKADPTQQFPTSELRVEGGLRWRFVLYKKIPRPELTLLVGGGRHSFAVDKNSDGTDVGPPDVAYTYATVGLALRLWFTEWGSLWGAFNYHAVTDAGSVGAADEFGKPSTFGLRAQGGLDFFVWRGLKVGVLGYYERFQLGFSNGAEPAPAKLATSAVDQYFGGILLLGYML
jgi:hypothetical protein